jgi:hypothetical protein
VLICVLCVNTSEYLPGRRSSSARPVGPPAGHDDRRGHRDLGLEGEQGKNLPINIEQVSLIVAY